MAGLSSQRIGARAPRAALAGIALATGLAHWLLLDALARADAPGQAQRPRAMAMRFVESPAPPPAVEPTALAVEAVALAIAEPVAEAAPAVQPAPAPPRKAVPRRAPIPKKPGPVAMAAALPAAPAPLLAARYVGAEAPQAEDIVLAAAAPSGDALPVYPTRIPTPFRFGYDMSRGMISGHGELAMQLTAGGYEARLQGTVAGFSILDWASRGGFDDAGFAPVRFVDQRRGRGAQAANFQRGADKITYSGTKVESPLPPGAQDRLSWMLQLAAIARARPERLVQGQRITMFVSGARGDADAWTFEVGARTPLETGAGLVQSIPLERAPRKEHDTRAQVWLDPERQYLPVKARLVSSREGADALELLLEEVQTPP